MSLQVWLPLNGNLNNQGLDGSLGFTNTASAAVAPDGKLGQCYSFSSTSGNGLLLSSGKSASEFMNAYINHHSWSLCAWIKTTSDDNVVFGLTYGLRLWCGSTNYVHLYNSTRNVGASNNISTIDGKWHHICATYNILDNAINIYVDGIKGTTTYYPSGETYASSWTNDIAIGRDFNNSTARPHYYFQGSMNDVRIYDHCLSAKEVKEISKGLICHYKLDNNGFGNPNLFFNSHFDSRYTVSDWDTSKNGSLCASDWGGYNGGVGNPSTVYHAHLQEHEGDYVYNYHKTSNENWLGISQSVVTSVEVNKTYTFSCELKRISGKNFANGGLYTKANSSTTDYTFVNWFEFSEFASVTDNKWHKYSCTFTIDSSVYMMNGASWFIYGHSWEDGEFLMRRPKLEEGSSATEWIPRSSDSLYTSLGLDSTEEPDCSGLENNGTKVGNIAYENSSVRYDGCYSFTGDDYIKIPKPITISNSSYFTVSMWVKPESGCGGYATVLSNFSSPASGFWMAINTEDSGTWFYNGTYAKGNSLLPIGQWSHIAMVFNAGAITWYTDGVATSTSNVSSNTTAFTNYIAIGNSYAGTTWNTDFVGNISDVRIYSTALSASDIKELYNTSASIDKNGNMYAYEFKEE